MKQTEKVLIAKAMIKIGACSAISPSKISRGSSLSCRKQVLSGLLVKKGEREKITGPCFYWFRERQRAAMDAHHFSWCDSTTQELEEILIDIAGVCRPLRAGNSARDFRAQGYN